MTPVTTSEVLGQFRAALIARGFEPPDSIIADGRLHRCNAAGARGRGDAAAELARNIQLFDYAMIGLAILIWTLVLTITIGCIIVWLMKGPAYVADGYEVSHSDKPRG